MLTFWYSSFKASTIKRNRMSKGHSVLNLLNVTGFRSLKMHQLIPDLFLAKINICKKSYSMFSNTVCDKTKTKQKNYNNWCLTFPRHYKHMIALACIVKIFTLRYKGIIILVIWDLWREGEPNGRSVNEIWVTNTFDNIGFSEEADLKRVYRRSNHTTRQPLHVWILLLCKIISSDVLFWDALQNTSKQN